MRIRKHILLISMALVTFLSCCKDDDDDAPNGEHFAELFTCKINGVEFRTIPTFYCNDEVFYFYEAGMGGLEDSYMLMSGVDCPNHLSVGLRNFGIIYGTGYLDFNQPTFADSCSPYIRHSPGPDIGILLFDSLISGGMNITTFTPRDSVTQRLGKIEGTFEFTVANEELDSVVHVTDGYFRFKVPNVW